MLVTDERFKTKNPLYMLDKGETLWDIVQLELSQVYFFINYELQEGDVCIAQQVIVWEIATFMGVCSGIQESADKRLTSVSLMIPAFMSQSGHWEMVTLKEIWLASLKKKKGRFFIFLAENGKRYIEGADVRDLSDDVLENVERYFPLSASNRKN